jgi:tetratricopeptide (TPR) repeat protein
MSLALSMIVRNGEADLPACLAGARPFVDEIVIADTGSTDRSMAIAQEYGARVIQIPWEDDFSKARNLSLAEVTADWVLSLDADERLDPQEARRLPQLMAAGLAGYQVTIRNYVRSATERLWDQPARLNDGSFAEAAEYPAYLEHQNVRLFRRDPEIYFVHRVHESVGPRILARGRPLGDAGFLIHHFGLAVQGEERRRKNERYRLMGQAKIRENPRDAQAHFELGLELFEHFGETEEALKSFETAARLNPNLAVAWLFQGLACLKMGHDAQAVECFRRARRGTRDTALIAESEGDAYYNLADCPAAARAYRRALELAPQTATVESKLGLTLVREGRGDEGVALLLQALTRQPSCGHLYDRLVAATVSLNRLEDAALAAECKLTNVSPDADAYLRAAVLRHRSGNGARAVALLQAGLLQFPDAIKLQQGLLELRG